MKKKFLAFVAAVMMMWGYTLGLAPVTEAAAADCDSTFLGFYPWYHGLTKEDGGTCVIDDGKLRKSGNSSQSQTSNRVAKFVWTIILNVAADLTLAVGYVAIGVIIWGGYWFITSNGDPGKAAKARRVLTAGIAGSIIAALGTVISRVLISVLTNGG